MGEFTINGIRFTSKDERPSADELEAARRAVLKREAAKNIEMKATDADIAAWSKPPGSMRVQEVPSPPAEGAPIAPRVAASEMAGEMPVAGAEAAPPPAVQPREFPDAPSTLQIPQVKAQGFTEYSSPWAAAKDLAHGVYDPKTGKWFAGSPATKDFGKIPGLLAGTLGPLSTDDPKHRQEIYLEQIPGAKAAEDKYGNPMIEYKGEKYYTSGKDLDRLRTALAVIGGTAIGASLPVSGPLSLLATGVGASVAQSVGEDLVAKASGSKGDAIDLEKAGWAAAFGTIPGAFALGKPLLGKLVYQAMRNVPFTDDMLREVGLTTAQIKSLTPAMRDEIVKVARTTFDDQTAVGATYRKELAKELGLTGEAGPTRGLLSGDPAQIGIEKRLAEQGGGAEAAAVINTRRAAQDVKLNEAQERLQAQAGGHPGTPPRTPEEAATTLQGGYDEAKAAQKVARDDAYKLARDPEAVVAEGGVYSVPAPKAAQIGPTTRSALENNDVGQIVLSDSAKTSTPFAKEALDVTERWGAKRTGSQRFAIDDPGATGIGLPDVTWQEAERLRQQLVALQKKAVAAAKGQGGISQDVAAMEQILANFDNHFGPLNPLYAPARKANEELKSIFSASGSVDHDAATKAVLKVMEGPEGGSAIVNTMFGGGFSKNQAGQMLDHLMTRVFPNHPEAQGAIREMALRRLLVDPRTGEALSPQKMVTAINRGLGDQEIGLYQKLLSGEDFTLLRQLHEQQKLIAAGRAPVNPSRSGTLLSALLMKGGGAGAGYIAGSEGDLGTAGTAALTLLGAAGGHYYPKIQAGRAVSPPANYLQSGAPGRVPGMVGMPVAGLLNQEQNRPGPGPIVNQPGPADRLMNDLLR